MHEVQGLYPGVVSCPGPHPARFPPYNRKELGARRCVPLCRHGADRPQNRERVSVCRRYAIVSEGDLHEAVQKLSTVRHGRDSHPSAL